MSPAVVIPGGSGFLGQALAQELVSDGYQVTILTRGQSQTDRGAVL